MYLKEIESYFVKQKGRGLILSPKDLTLIKGWQEKGIPLEIVLKGIKTTFANPKGQERRITSISYCQPEILRAWDAYRETKIGTVETKDGEEKENFIPRRIDGIKRRLLALIDQSETPPLRNLLKQTCQELDRLRSKVERNRIKDFDQIEKELGKIEQLTLSNLFMKLDESERKKIESSCADQLRRERLRMSKEAYQETLSALIKKALRNKFNLPAISLYFEVSSSNLMGICCKL
ncbi:MAG: hypothetical protein QME81_14860 [bacterium]|nr:hypothetical protein [bacterium]